MSVASGGSFGFQWVADRSLRWSLMVPRQSMHGLWHVKAGRGAIVESFERIIDHHNRMIAQLLPTLGAKRR